MSPRLSGLTANVVVFIVIGVFIFVESRAIQANLAQSDVEDGLQTAAVQLSLPAGTTITPKVSVDATTDKSVQVTKTVAVETAIAIQQTTVPPPASVQSTPSASSTTDKFQAVRIQNPYSTPPLPFDQINVSTRLALVNILCMPHGGSMKPISGTGVIIDPRGVILTNAHVAQYVLLSEIAQINLACSIRTGSPAIPRWTAEVLYMPPAWVSAHVADINTDHPMGTGEHDYALLRITGSVDGALFPAAFPYLPFDIREAIGFVGDTVLGAAYPAEFVGGFNAQNNLNAVSSVSNISQLLTLNTDTVDLLSISDVIEAQAGSSGGAVVNAWGKLIGIITTVGEGQTTSERSLRALTISYIDHDLHVQTGSGLDDFLQGDPIVKEANFNDQTAQGLLDQYAKYILK